MEHLKQEANKCRQDLNSFRALQERQCLCKYYEETLNKVKDENQRYIDKLKATY